MADSHSDCRHDQRVNLRIRTGHTPAKEKGGESVKQNWIIGLIGPTGSGKTHLARAIIERCSRVLIFNPAEEENFTGRRVLGNPSEAWKATSGSSWKIHYLPEILRHRQGESIDAPGLDYVCRIAWKRQNCLLVVDEAHFICTPHTITEGFVALVRTGRQHLVSIMWISQGFADVSRILTKNSREYVFYRIHEPGDLLAIRKRCGAEVADRVANLKREDHGHCLERLRYVTDTGEWRVESC